MSDSVIPILSQLHKPPLQVVIHQIHNLQNPQKTLMQTELILLISHLFFYDICFPSFCMIIICIVKYVRIISSLRVTLLVQWNVELWREYG